MVRIYKLRLSLHFFEIYFRPDNNPLKIPRNLSNNNLLYQRKVLEECSSLVTIYL
jgi:hypothetical protein